MYRARAAWPSYSLLFAHRDFACGVRWAARYYRIERDLGQGFEPIANVQRA